MSELQKRVATGIVGGAVLLFILLKGGIFLSVFLLLAGIIMSLELNNAFKKIGIKINLIAMIIGCAVIFLEYFIEMPETSSLFAVFLVTFLFVLLTDEHTVQDGIYTVFCFLYAPFLLSTLRHMDKTPFLFLVIILAFGTDTFAYFVGVKFGKHKLIPKVSPKKSVEGAIGGIVGSLILSLIFMYFTKINITWATIPFLILASIASEIGDLVASKLKRYTGIKDFGNILPGHGGIMDRFDSIILVSPVIYFAFEVLKEVI